MCFKLPQDDWAVQRVNGVTPGGGARKIYGTLLGPYDVPRETVHVAFFPRQQQATYVQLTKALRCPALWPHSAAISLSLSCHVRDHQCDRRAARRVCAALHNWHRKTAVK